MNTYFVRVLNVNSLFNFDLNMKCLMPKEERKTEKWRLAVQYDCFDIKRGHWSVCVSVGDVGDRDKSGSIGKGCPTQIVVLFYSCAVNLSKKKKLNCRRESFFEFLFNFYLK